MNRLLFILICITTSAFFHSCKKGDTLFVEIPSSKSGIDFINQLNSSPELNILTYLYYYNGAGVVAADFNNDGFIDLYFTANQQPDKLYLNRGDFKFEDVTVPAGIHNETGWTTGVTHVDINNDGLSDLYICKVSDFGEPDAHNLLFINQGPNQDGIPTFKEEAVTYGLDISGYSTQASFFDFDLDGDLDMFLLNHSVHPNRTYGRGKKRTEHDSKSGDRLLRNDGGTFTDVSAEAGIFQGEIGYGLGLGISDVNNDGYPDIYVGNDFFENDYLYVNQKDGTFKEVISDSEATMGHTSHFSMGNDLADINNDNMIDIVSLDMLPEDLQTYKTSGLEYSFQTYDNYLKNGFAPQYMQNTLHINLGNASFSENGHASGIASTEWSWGALLADLDNDGYKDLFISNGIKGATNDMDFINFIANENIQKRINKGMSVEDLALIDEIPEKKVPNYFFKNNGDATFTNVTENWFKKLPSFSNGAVYADLDNDGDLDLVVNNVNEKAFILKNTSEKQESKTNYLKLTFNGSTGNTKGVGVKAVAFLKGMTVSQENFVSRGYLSAVPPNITLGLNKQELIDSLLIIWPGGAFQKLKEVKANQKLNVSRVDAGGNYYEASKNTSPSMISNAGFLPFKHSEYPSVEFNRDPLIPFAYSNLGPAIAVADVNNDGFEDVFIGGAKTQSSSILIQQTDGQFLASADTVFEEDKMSEDVSAVFSDVNNDGWQDLIVASGGNEFKTGKPLQPRLYINKEGVFTKDTLAFKGIEINASTVKVTDLNADGAPDITIMSNQLPWQYGVTPPQHIFFNNGKGTFTEVTESFAPGFKDLGNVQDIIWQDLNNDGRPDAVVVGHWMPVTIFHNDGTSLTRQTNNGLDLSNGWWNTVKAADFDNDGDLDIVAGNWGLNSRLKASNEEPINLYSNDFDDNGSVEPVVTYYYQHKETPFSSKDELVKQMPFLNKKYLSYADFAKADFKDLLPGDKLESAYKKQVFELASCYFENMGNGQFRKQLLPFQAQVSCMFDIFIDDYNNDGFQDLLLAGNNYEISTQLGRLDASHGALILNDGKGNFRSNPVNGFDIAGPARNIVKLKLSDKVYYLIAMNNDKPILLKKE